jgi:hypothetical protein
VFVKMMSWDVLAETVDGSNAKSDMVIVTAPDPDGDVAAEVVV